MFSLKKFINQIFRRNVFHSSPIDGEEHLHLPSKIKIVKGINEDSKQTRVQIGPKGRETNIILSNKVIFTARIL